MRLAVPTQPVDRPRTSPAWGSSSLAEVTGNAKIQSPSTLKLIGWAMSPLVGETFSCRSVEASRLSEFALCKENTLKWIRAVLHNLAQFKKNFSVFIYKNMALYAISIITNDTEYQSKQARQWAIEVIWGGYLEVVDFQKMRHCIDWPVRSSHMLIVTVQYSWEHF